MQRLFDSFAYSLSLYPCTQMFSTLGSPFSLLADLLLEFIILPSIRPSVPTQCLTHYHNDLVILLTVHLLFLSLLHCLTIN